MGKYLWMVRRRRFWNAFLLLPDWPPRAKHIFLIQKIYYSRCRFLLDWRLRYLAGFTHQAGGNRATAYPTARVGGWSAASFVSRDTIDCIWVCHCRDCLGMHDADPRSYRGSGSNNS